MRRPTRLGIAAAIALLLVAGGYTAYWFIAARRIEGGVGLWADSLHTHNLDLSWRTSRVVGYPLAFRLELTDVRLRRSDGGAVPQVSLPRLTAQASPWNFHVFRLAAPAGITATSGGAPAPATLKVGTAQGSVALTAGGGLRMWLRLGGPELESGPRIAARSADLWLNLPPHPPRNHDDPAFGAALAIHEVALPVMPAPFRKALDEVSLALTMRGRVPAAPPRQAAAEWRDSGGTLDFDRFALRWGGLAITGSGTLALDAELQPIGGFSGEVEGYQELMTALVAAGRVKAADARLAGLALALLSRTGPDGRPQISTSFTIQDGQMYLGPAKLGPAPRIAWQ